MDIVIIENESGNTVFLFSLAIWLCKPLNCLLTPFSHFYETMTISGIIDDIY